MQVFNYQGPASNMVLLNWRFPFVAFTDVCSDLLGWCPCQSTSLTLRVYFSCLKTGSPTGEHELRAEHHREQTKVTYQGTPWGKQGFTLNPDFQDTRHL